MKRRLFILSYIGYYNLGDDLMVDLINEKNMAGFEIIALSRRNYNNKLKYMNRYDLIRYFFSIRKNDVLMNLGGIFQDQTGWMSFFYYFIMNLVFLFKQGHIIFFNTDFLDVQYSKIFSRFLLGKSKLTILRSKEEYRNYYKRFKNVYYCPDIVFSYQFNKLTKIKHGKSYTLISLRKHGEIKQYLKKYENDPFGFKLLLMFNEVGLKKQIMKHFSEDDILVYNYHNKNEVINLIYNAKKIITMRYHVGIIGLLFNKQIRIMDYSRKMEILNRDFGLFYINNKKNIDKINKKRYINKIEIKKSWNGFFRKIGQI